MLEGFSFEAILSDYSVGILLFISTSILSAIGGYFKGKKKANKAIDRKNTLYQPLVNDLIPISTYDLDVQSIIKIDFLSEVVCNNYKYAISDELYNKMKMLAIKVDEYNEINLIKVANNVLIRQFEEGFTDLYGSTIDGVSYDGDIEIEHEAEEVEAIRQGDHDKLIRSLLKNEDLADYPIFLTNDHVDYTYREIISIYESSFYLIIDGKRMPQRKMKVQWKGSPSEYIAYHYDFFKEFQNDIKVLKKYELREDIILQAQSILQDLKDLIENIVKIFEKEHV